MCCDLIVGYVVSVGMLEGILCGVDVVGNLLVEMVGGVV